MSEPIKKLLLSACGIIIILHIWGSVYPSHANWGFHFYGFYGAWAGIAALALILIFAVPKVRIYTTGSLERLLRSLAKLPATVNFLIAAALLISLIYLFPAKIHLLGDGAVLLRSVPLGINSSEISLSFRNQPLMFWIYRMAMNLHPFEASPNSYTVYYIIAVTATVGFLALLFWSMRLLQLPVTEKFLLGCVLMFGAGSQFFFGYVENYVLQYVMTFAYVLTGWYALEKRISVVFPVLCLIMMVTLHLGNIVFVPSLILCIFYKWRKNKLRAVMLLGGIGIIGTAVLYYAGFNLVDMTRHLKSGTVDILQPFTARGGMFAYPMFSFAHLLDWLNSNLLAAPFGLLVTSILIPALPRERRWNNPILIFLTATALCGIFFTWVVNSALGLARDWDLFAGFFIPLSVLPVYLFSQVSTIPERRSVIFLTALILLLHTVPWIGINASGDRHLARMKSLDSRVLFSRAAQMAHHEALANYFFDTQQYRDAKTYYRLYMDIDSMNPRIIGNMADVLRRLDERDGYFYMLKRAVKLNSPDPGVYSNLGVEYAARGDTANAIAFNEKAIGKNPKMTKAHANLGILYTAQGKYKAAESHFSAAINLGMRDPALFRFAADACVYLGEYRRAIQYYDVYMASNPGDEKVGSIRSRVYEALMRQQEFENDKKSVK